ncbi:protein of unknown function (plasmid) [Caballeronia sp. S22]
MAERQYLRGCVKTFTCVYAYLSLICVQFDSGAHFSLSLSKSSPR